VRDEIKIYKMCVTDRYAIGLKDNENNSSKTCIAGRHCFSKINYKQFTYQTVIVMYIGHTFPV